jgi:hypothetical protein
MAFFKFVDFQSFLIFNRVLMLNQASHWLLQRTQKSLAARQPLHKK